MTTDKKLLDTLESISSDLDDFKEEVDHARVQRGIDYDEKERLFKVSVNIESMLILANRIHELLTKTEQAE